MKYTTPFISLAILFMFSCKGQVKTSPKEEIKESIVKKEKVKPPADFDPYFTETTDITKFFGPISITRNITQDKRGNMWFASWEGIMKYDGNTFTNFTNKDSLRRFHVFNVLEDRHQNLWFGTIGAGVFFYDGITFTNFTTKDGLATDRTGWIYEDQKGIIWIGTDNGISRYDGDSFQNFYAEGEEINNDVNAIVEDENGKFWIGTRGKAFTFDGEKFTTIINDLGNPFSNVRTIIKDKNGNMWLGGNDGLWRYDNNTFTRYTMEFVGYIYEDRQGLIWTSSSKSGSMEDWVLTRYEINPLPLVKPDTTIFEPNVGMLFGITEDTDGNIWFGNLNGVGRYDGKTFEYFRENNAKE
jgi:ligand-binding sensor domain-containing protein